MKHRKYLFIFLFFSIFLFFLMSIQKLWRKTDDYKERFILITPLEWDRIGIGALAADDDLGTSTKLVTFSQDENSQVEALKYALRTNVDGIITAGGETSGKLEKILMEIKDAGIPVILVDTDVEESYRNCYIGCDNYEVGSLGGKAVIDVMDNSANVCLVILSNKSKNQRERVEGFYSAIQNFPEIKIVSILEGNSDLVILQKKLPEILQKFPEIDTLVFAEGTVSYYGIDILKNAEIDPMKYKIVTLDYMEANREMIKNGQYEAGVFHNQYQMGYQAVQYLFDLCNGVERMETNIYTELKLYTEENIDVVECEQEEEIKWYRF